MLPASALPVIVGVLSLVVVEKVVKDDGASGAVVSIVIANGAEADDVLPAVSIAIAIKEYVPVLSIEEVIEKTPFSFVFAEPKRVVPLYRFTVLPASALPVIVGVLSLVVVEEVVKDVGVLIIPLDKSNILAFPV